MSRARRAAQPEWSSPSVRPLSSEASAAPKTGHGNCLFPVSHQIVPRLPFRCREQPGPVGAVRRRPARPPRRERYGAAPCGRATVARRQLCRARPTPRRLGRCVARLLPVHPQAVGRPITPSRIFLFRPCGQRPRHRMTRRGVGSSPPHAAPSPGDFATRRFALTLALARPRLERSGSFSPWRGRPASGRSGKREGERLGVQPREGREARQGTPDASWNGTWQSQRENNCPSRSGRAGHIQGGRYLRASLRRSASR
jgi:hypothetical protein